MATSKNRKHIIDEWLSENQHNEPLINEFHEITRRYYHKKEFIQKWLLEHGLEIRSLATIYKWVKQNILPGDQAALFNADCRDYQGIDIVSAMEKTLAQLVRVSRIYIDKIEASHLDEIPLERAIEAIPNYAREIRSIAEQVNKILIFRETSDMALDGAARIYEIVTNDPSIKGTADEDYMRRILEAAIGQLENEIATMTIK